MSRTAVTLRIPVRAFCVQSRFATVRFSLDAWQGRRFASAVSASARTRPGLPSRVGKLSRTKRTRALRLRLEAYQGSRRLFRGESPLELRLKARPRGRRQASFPLRLAVAHVFAS